jgi:uncharacterized Zn-binding protein involved in type VI secretion
MHTCPMVNPGPVPHVGGPEISGSADVITGYMPQGRVGDTLICVPATDKIAKGSSNVLVNGKMAARIGDSTVHGGVIVAGCPTVIIPAQRCGQRHAVLRGVREGQEGGRGERAQGAAAAERTTAELGRADGRGRRLLQEMEGQGGPVGSAQEARPAEEARQDHQARGQAGAG